jgi:hypothetical protein
MSKLRGKARQRERARRRLAEQRQVGPLVMSQGPSPSDIVVPMSLMLIDGAGWRLALA